MLVLIFCAAYRSPSPLHAVWFPLLLLVVSSVFSYYLLRDASPFRYSGVIYVRRFHPRAQVQFEYQLRREQQRQPREHREELFERLLPPPSDNGGTRIVCACGLCDTAQRPRAYSAPDFDTLGLLNLVRGANWGFSVQRGGVDSSQGGARPGQRQDSVGLSIPTSSARRGSVVSSSSNSSSLPVLDSCFLSHSWINAVIRKKERRWARFCQRWHMRQELLRQKLELHKHYFRRQRWEQEGPQQGQQLRQQQHHHHQQRQERHGYAAYSANGAANARGTAETCNSDAGGDGHLFGPEGAV
ncbi:hypothetical protein, conserved [Eimeria brunetti]|uniref:Transmembrane protein n=1 Tax=Eimeria brunetti TaxID=51314 RepID=U6LKE2_9EIME|nr:hypothetical protein, conserved [Eimeria brunetti]